MQIGQRCRCGLLQVSNCGISWLDSSYELEHQCMLACGQACGLTWFEDRLA